MSSTSTNDEREALAIDRSRRGEISASVAAEVAGRSLSDMLRLLSKLGLPLTDASPASLEGEARLVERLLAERVCRGR